MIIDYMMSLNQKEIARICLTHSYPIQDVNTFLGKFDCTEEQKAFLSCFIKNTIYDDYDRLIQLCDAISLPSGACIIVIIQFRREDIRWMERQS